jgi:hypothetical protein
VKPADHPEFFRLPAPGGASRESSIVLDACGEFWHDGERIARRDMRDAFARWISRHPDSGRFILQNGYDWVFLSVEGVPYFVRGIRNTPNGLELTLSDGTLDLLGRGGLSVDASGVVYARIKAGREWARFTPDSQLALEPFLVEWEGATAVVGPEGPDVILEKPI